MSQPRPYTRATGAHSAPLAAAAARTMQPMEPPSTGTVARAVAVLRALAETDGDATVAGLAARLGLPRPTVHRLLGLLREQGMVDAHESTRTYAVGQEFFRIAALVTKRQQLGALARPEMERIVDACGETCLLGVYLPAHRQMMFAEEAPSVHPLGYRVDMLTPISLVWGASGRAILAFRPEGDIDEILRVEGPSPVTGARLPSAATTHDELAQVRAQGYAYTQGQKIPGSRGVAAPILAADGWAVGSLCLTIPEMRFDDGSAPRLGELLMEHASIVSGLLGYEAPAAAPRL
jgi:DNA-binding IclR family transcriptional regulator